MNKTEFIHLIDNPDLLGTKQVGELKQILANFPYFTHARVLITKALYNEKHYEYEKYLKQTALAVPDREVLYHYLHDLTPHWFTLNTPEIHKPEVQIAAVINSPEVVAPLIETPVVAVEVAIDEPLVVEEPAELIVEDVKEITPEPILVEETNIIKVDDEVELSDDELKADLVINALLEESLILQAEPTSEFDIEAVEVEKNIVEEILLQQPTIVDEVSIESEINEENNAAEGTELTFVEWLLQQNSPHIETDSAKIEKEITKQQTIKPKIETPILPVEPEKVAQPIAKPLFSPNLPEVTKADIDEAVANSNVNNFHNILDRFIKENPSISRPKAEFFNPVNMARQSVEEDDDLVTETLANLLYKQGNYKKAIKAYEKLCLLYPSKMSYFASLIKKIKTEQKD